MRQYCIGRRSKRYTDSSLCRLWIHQETIVEILRITIYGSSCILYFLNNTVILELHRAVDKQNSSILLDSEDIMGLSYSVLRSGYPVYKSLTPGRSQRFVRWKTVSLYKLSSLSNNSVSSAHLPGYLLSRTEIQLNI